MGGSGCPRSVTGGESRAGLGLPKLLEWLGTQLAVMRRMLDVGVAKPELQASRIVARNSDWRLRLHGW